jgi:hypothetical protein
MERNPYSPSEDAEGKTSNKDKKSDGFRVTPFHIPGLAENKYPPRPAQRQEAPRASVALEGVISWREQDEMKHSIIRHDEGTREKKDEDQEKDDEEHETKPVSKESPAQARPRSARPIGEIIAEQQAIQKAKEAAAEAKEESESDEDEEQKIQQTIQARLPRTDVEPPKTVTAEHNPASTESDEDYKEPLQDFTPTRPLTAFPQVTPRAEYQQPTASQPEASDGGSVEDEQQPLPAGAVHQTLPMQGPGVAEQQPLPEDDDENTPMQPQYAQAYPVAPQVNGVMGQNPNYQPPVNPNNQNTPINPAVWNQMPNPNAPMAAMGNGNMPPVNPNLPGGNMGGNGNQPPVQPGYYNQQPFGPNNPAFGYNQAQSSYDSSFNSSPTMPIEHPHEVNARDPRVGVVAAALGLEYFARKRADRKLEKRINKSAEERDRKQQKEAASNTIREREQQRRFDTEQQRQADELYRMRQAQQGYDGGAGTTAPGTEYAAGLPKPFETANQAADNQYTPAGQFSQTYNQAPTQSYTPGQQPGMNQGVRQEVGVPMGGQRQEQRPQPQEAEIVETQNVEPQGHVEQSSWHNIVVDEHGREIAGAMQYGEGFRRERQQEVRNDPMSDAPSSSAHRVSGGSNGSAGSANLFAGGTVSQQGVPTNVVYDQYGRPMQNLPSGMTNPTLPAGHPMHADPQHQLEPSFKQPSNIANPWFWIMLLLIIAAFFTAAFV